VTLLTPRGSLAESSRFVTRVAYLADNATPVDWIHAVAATARAVSPVQLLPCDDVSFRLLSMLVLSPPPQLQPSLQAELAKLVRASLGDPAHYRASVDKTMLPAAAARADVPVPASTVVSTPTEAIAFAGAHGYPLVVKRPFTTAGDGVRITTDATALGDAVTELTAPKLDDLEPDASRRLVVQKHIDGHICYQYGAAWQGRMLACYGGDRLQADGSPRTQGTVVRFRKSPELRVHSERLVQAFGMTGLFASEFVIERSTDRAYLLDIDRRVGPAMHFGSTMNVDLCAALHAAIHDLPSPTRADLDEGEARVFVEFPAEWLRDPRSRWLREHPVDMPWDDPELLDAMLALHRER
jgi:predicted ATP-grasp superfamily ATP-dependent carboligase